MAVRPARAANEVWTVDFKGWYRTGDGTRVEPLTVRDLYSHYSFCVRLLKGQCLTTTKREMQWLFRLVGPAVTAELPRRYTLRRM